MSTILQHTSSAIFRAQRGPSYIPWGQPGTLCVVRDDLFSGHTKHIEVDLAHRLDEPILEQNISMHDLPPIITPSPDLGISDEIRLGAGLKAVRILAVLRVGGRLGYSIQVLTTCEGRLCVRRDGRGRRLRGELKVAECKDEQCRGESFECASAVLLGATAGISNEVVAHGEDSRGQKAAVMATGPRLSSCSI
jgi:hypothetical protein